MGSNKRPLREERVYTCKALRQGISSYLKGFFLNTCNLYFNKFLFS